LYPTQTILIDVPAEIGLGRLKGLDRLESEPIDFHERVRQEFLQIALLDPERYLIVDGTQPVEKIYEEIIPAVAQLPALIRNEKGSQENRLLRPVRIATSAVTSTVSRAVNATQATARKAITKKATIKKKLAAKKKTTSIKKNNAGNSS
jgi:dTMP kinase